MADAFEPETLSFEARDGLALAGSLYLPKNPKVGIVISAGTGFPRSFYHGAASYLAQQGAAVLTYDYRGMGESKPDHETFLGIEYTDWGRHDTPAAIDALAARCEGIPLTHLAHSVGGHFLGLIDNHARVARHAFVSVGTGYFGGHHLRNIPTELYFWWVLGTVSLTRHGYIASEMGWSGEPLPPKLFKTWRRWSKARPYFKPDLKARMQPHHFDSVTAPIRSWIFSDDPIATPQAGADLLEVYPAAPTEIVQRTPSDYGLNRIGHEGAFRKRRERLWSELWDWLSKAAP